jgi:hypothetical protein
VPEPGGAIDYPHYVTDRSGRIYSGWEFPEDAKDALRELQGESPGIDARVESKIMRKRRLGLEVRPTDWMDNEEVVARVREGQYGKPPVRGADLERFIHSAMEDMPEYSTLNSEEAQRLLREAGPEERDRMVRQLSSTWTDEYGNPRSPRQVQNAERMILEDMAYGSRTGGRVPTGAPAILPPTHEYYDIEDRPTPQDEYARGMTRESFGEAAEKGIRAAEKGVRALGEALPKLAKALLGGALMEIAGEVVFPMEAEAETGVPEGWTSAELVKWENRRREAEKFMLDPRSRPLMWGLPPEEPRDGPEPESAESLVGGMPTYAQRPVFD